MRLLVELTPRDASAGLAVDEALLDSARCGGEDALRLWVSRRSVVIGRSQALASECDDAALRRFEVPALRRISGGGAVYHYPGNLNASLSVANSGALGSVEMTFARFAQAVARGASSLGVAARADGRCVLAQGAKVAGAAQARRGRAALIHGTVLVAPDVLDMCLFLRALRPEYAPRGTPSRPHPTITLSEAARREVAVAEAAGAVAKAMIAEFGGRGATGSLTPGERARADELERTKYRSAAWNASR